MARVDGHAGSLRRRAGRRAAPWLAGLLWTLLVLYPNPTLLPRAIAHAYNPPIDPAAVQVWANQLPDDPKVIEQQVLDRYVPYAVPWQTLDVPWYYPTTAEVVATGRGDCEARALVLASILQAKGIPYRLVASFDHIWVDYPGKQANGLENASLAIMDNGRLQLPKIVDWRQSWEIEREYFWDFMPWSRRILLIGGLAALIFRRPLARLGRYVRRRVPLLQPGATTSR